jgi:hypothetical protein
MSDAWRKPFENALEDDPSNQHVRRDLADHLSEVGDPDAEPVRWMAERGVWPRLMPAYRGGPLRWRFPDASQADGLPWPVWDRLAASVFGWPTRRAAERGLCRAYRWARAAGWDPASM